MEATAVSLARSVLDGALSSVGTAVAEEAALLLGVPREVEFIRNELEMMGSFLKVATANPEADETAKTWVKQVRDLAYDVEDCLLDFALYASSSRRGAICGCGRHPGGSLADRHRVAARIQEIKASVEELNLRFQRYCIVVDHHRPPPRDADDQQEAAAGPLHQPRSWARNISFYLRKLGIVRSSPLSFQESDIIGRESDKAKLTQLISGRSGESRRLRMVSVWGMGGMGKSSLVRMVRGDPALLDEFDCAAWVTVPHPLDSANEFNRRLKKQLQIGGAQEQDDVREYLREKRYMIIVDDLLGMEEWEHIWPVLNFDDNKASCIIVTTRREDVARRCVEDVTRCVQGHADAYELKGLGEDESKNLLFQKVYKSTVVTLSTEMVELADQAGHILKRCRGLPLAISTIGGLLANRPKTKMEWMKLDEYLGAELETDLNNITKVIASSYDGLPYHLKSIFLYLSIFPENHEIRRTRLLRRWMAEGYIAKNRVMPVEEVGKRFYNELINRSMIQPSKKMISPSVRVGRCWIHGMVLQIILTMFIEQNQLFLIKKNSNEVPQSKVRHLVISRWKRRDEKLENINLSYIRSLTVFGECPVSLISHKMRLLRVLDLEDTVNLKNEDLRHIGKLHHLKYLCLRGTDISKLPSSLQNLRCLETLDIQDTQVAQLPDGIAKLEKLRYLLGGINFSKDLLHKVGQSKASHKPNLLGNMVACLCCNRSDYCRISDLDRFSVTAPEGVEKLKDLHMLGVISVGQGNGVAGKLKELTNLERLGVTGFSKVEGKELCKSIGMLSRLQRLEVRSDSLKFLAKMDESAVPKHLVSLRLYGSLLELPKWVLSLNDLAKVKLLGTKLTQGQVELFGTLSNLALLSLWENSYEGTSLHFLDRRFPKLKFLDIDGLKKITMVTIDKGAMPELEQLWVNKCTALHDSAVGLKGVEHLPNLNELLLKCGEKENLMKILQDQVSKHNKRPRFLIGKSIPKPDNQ